MKGINKTETFGKFLEVSSHVHELVGGFAEALLTKILGRRDAVTFLGSAG